jgi:DNA-directed RNA polymerase subunit RPC12/RpoP
MGYTLDYFVAAMKCYNCGRISPEDDSTNMQTYIRDKPNLESLGVGKIVGEHSGEIDGYLKISNPVNEVILLDVWECPYCSYTNWASITIKDGIIINIKPVKLEKKVLNQANYVSQLVSSDAIHLSNENLDTVLKNGILETLERVLK